MKKTIISMLLLAAFVSPASAKVRSRVNSRQVPYMQNSAIDHSKDVAFTAGMPVASPAPDADFTMGQSATAMSPVAGKTLYYTYDLNGVTVHGRYAQVDMNGSYQGKDNPSWDGPEANKYRNMRAYNESEPLPPNSGNRSK